MDIFSEVELTWGNNTYKVPPEKVLQLIATIEEHVTLEELMGTNLKRVKIANAYTAALRFAGSRALPSQVYAALYDKEDQNRIYATVDALLRVMIPPEQLRKMMPKVEESEVKKNSTAG